MAHTRKRSILAAVKKSLKFWPVTSILGPRQCGKTTFLKELQHEGSRGLVSLDRKADRKMANENPELFLTRFSQRPLLIDEAHKSPELFDEIKAEVDSGRRPGMFVLSGSIYFSKKIGIQESLTGRSSVIRMDTMNLQETNDGKKIDLKSILKYFETGGMPGVCFLRDSALAETYWEQWMETTCHRDLKVFSQGKLSGDLAEEIIEQCCKLEFPNQSNIAHQAGVDARRIKTHLDALEDLFVLRRIAPSSNGTGKDIYLPFDSGLAKNFTQDQRRLWQISFLSHQLNFRRFLSIKSKAPRYYLTARHSFIDFELDESLHLFCDKPNPTRSELMTIQAAIKANPFQNYFIHCATQAFRTIREKGFTLSGWCEGFENVVD